MNGETTIAILQEHNGYVTFFEMRYTASEMRQVFNEIERAELDAGRVIRRHGLGAYVSATALAREAFAKCAPRGGA